LNKEPEPSKEPKVKHNIGKHEKYREITEMAKTLLSTARDHKIESKKINLRAKSTLNIKD
jgi:hypothetical protein